MHQVAARAVCFAEAMTNEFKQYARAIKGNAQRLGEILAEGGLRLVSGGTENHLVLVDLRPLDLRGDVAEAALGRAGIVVNMNMIPFDPNPPRQPSGLRIGTPTVTSRGMGSGEIEKIGHWIVEVLKDVGNDTRIEAIRGEVREMAGQFPAVI